MFSVGSGGDGWGEGVKQEVGKKIVADTPTYLPLHFLPSTDSNVSENRDVNAIIMPLLPPPLLPSPITHPIHSASLQNSSHPYFTFPYCAKLKVVIYARTQTYTHARMHVCDINRFVFHFNVFFLNTSLTRVCPPTRMIYIITN